MNDTEGAIPGRAGGGAFARWLSASVATAVTAAALAAVPAVAGEPTPGREMTNFGYKGTAAGVKLFVNNVRALTATDAVAPLRCTRMTGRRVHESADLTTRDIPLVELPTSTSETVSYHDGRRHGVRATNALGDITLGDASAEVPTPVVTLRGLSTTAEAFHTPEGYGHEESIGYEQFAIALPPGQEVPAELQGLLDAIEEGADQVLDVLEQAPGPIEIPGLGTVALGRVSGATHRHSATSDVVALEFVISASGEDQLLQLGHSRARIGGPPPGGVFRSTSMPMDIRALEGDVHLGGVRPRTIPCEGTRGKVRTKHLDSASAVLPSGAVVHVRNVDYTFLGTQRRNGTAKGFDANHIDAVSMFGGQFVITDIDARVDVGTRTPDGKVSTTYRTSIGSISYFGEDLAIPKPGGTTPLPNGEGYLERQIINAAERWGGRVTALRVSLVEENLVIDFGIAGSQIFGY